MFAELHFHLFPGVDDGPATMEQAVALARLAAADGTSTILSTPHLNAVHPTEAESIPGRTEEIGRRLKQDRVAVRVLGAAELGHEMVGRLSQRELECIAQGPPGRRWVLLEAALGGIDQRFSDAADELRERGFGIVMAHPERAVARLATSWRAVEHELRAGSVMQINAWSLAGLHGEQARSAALRILRLARRVVVASDAHGIQRAPSLRLAVDVLNRLGHPSPARLVSAAPLALLTEGLAASPTSVAA